MANEIIPFGKYKGQAVEVIAETDAKYLEWLQLQPFLGAKFPKLLQAIHALSTGEATETPEHNALQALFLEDAFCTALLRIAKSGISSIKVNSFQRVMENDNGSDVWLNLTYHYQPTKEAWEEEAKWQADHGSKDRPLASFEESRWSARAELFIEIKPLLGDDYPAVLRQMRQQEKRARGYDSDYCDKIGILVIEDFFSSAITLEQLRQVFHPYRVFTIQDIKDEINRELLG